MSSKDTKAKEFMAVNERFADLFNFYLFQGEQIIKPADLEERDTTEILSLYGVKRKEVHKQGWRDLLKNAVVKFSKGTYFVLLGLENQSEVHYAMPVKNMIYDSMNYGAQVREAARQHRELKEAYDTGAEFLSGFMKEDKLTPVITLTLYWGADAWDGPMSLHDMLHVEDKSLLKYIQNYKINLIVPKEIEDFDKFQTCIGEVLEAIKASGDWQEMKHLISTNERFENLEADAVQILNIYTGIDIEMKEEEEMVNMCKAWEEQKNRGIEEGKLQGLEQGKLEMLYKLVQDGVLTATKAAEEANMSMNQFLQSMMTKGFETPKEANEEKQD